MLRVDTPGAEESGHVATVETRYAHIVLDDRGVPHVADTTMKVVEFVTDPQAYGWSAEELAVQCQARAGA